MAVKESKKRIRKNMFNKHAEFYEPNPENTKAYRSEEVLNSVIEVDMIRFNIDERSMDRFDRIVDIANWQYNQHVANGDDFTTAYQKAYVDQTFNWKSADNQFVTVSVETLAKVQLQALHNLNTIWQKYG